MKNENTYDYDLTFTFNGVDYHNPVELAKTKTFFIDMYDMDRDVVGFRRALINVIRNRDSRAYRESSMKTQDRNDRGPQMVYIQAYLLDKAMEFLVERLDAMKNGEKVNSCELDKFTFGVTHDSPELKAAPAEAGMNNLDQDELISMYDFCVETGRDINERYALSYCIIAEFNLKDQKYRRNMFANYNHQQSRWEYKRSFLYYFEPYYHELMAKFPLRNR